MTQSTLRKRSHPSIRAGSWAVLVSALIACGTRGASGGRDAGVTTTGMPADAEPSAGSGTGGVVASTAGVSGAAAGSRASARGEAGSAGGGGSAGVAGSSDAGTASSRGGSSGRAMSRAPVALLDANETELKAFPTAEGYGRYASGGRGGRVIEVTNLEDSGPGSLRDAVVATGPRTVVFRVSGVIQLESKLVIKKENTHLTVAGQTAPGKGVVVHGYTFGMTGGEHVVLRFVRTRVGTSSNETMDGMGITGSLGPVIYDHCSISWTIDEAFSSRGTTESNFTLQRTLISEALNEAGHSKYPAGTQHGYAASISGDIGSFHHNLLAHNAGRNWSLAGGLKHGTLQYHGRLDIRNNVVYNWRNRTTDGGAHQVNFVNNYYKPGPASEIFIALDAQNDGFEGGQYFYFAGNVMPGHFDESNQEEGRIATGEPRDYDPWVDEPFFESHVRTQSAQDAYEDVLADVGANRPVLDDHDKRIIEEVRAGTFTYRGSRTGYPGLIDNESDVGGLEDYPMIERPADWDADHDGMPDEWETKHGLDPADPEDRNDTHLSKVGYTNLEIYLNELAGDFR